MAYIRKADREALNEAVEWSVLAIDSELNSLRDALPRAIYTAPCPDRLIDELRREVMNRIGDVLFAPITAPLSVPTEEG